MSEIVVPRDFAKTCAYVAMGALFCAGGGLLVATSPAAGVLMLVVGVPALAIHGKALVTRAPMLRADPAGVWFGGGRVIRWDAIDTLYDTSIHVQHGAMLRGRAISVSFDFRRKRTLFATPVAKWLAAPFSVGDVDVGIPGDRGRARSLVAQLQALKAEILQPTPGSGH